MYVYHYKNLPLSFRDFRQKRARAVRTKFQDRQSAGYLEACQEALGSLSWWFRLNFSRKWGILSSNRKVYQVAQEKWPSNIRNSVHPPSHWVPRISLLENATSLKCFLCRYSSSIINYFFKLCVQWKKWSNVHCLDIRALKKNLWCGDERRMMVVFHLTYFTRCLI